MSRTEPTAASWPAPDVAHTTCLVSGLLLLLAPTLPGPTRMIVLPALLLGPGCAFLLSLGGRVQPDARTVSLAAPLSVALAIAACLLANAGGVVLGPTSVALALGGLTAALTGIGYLRRLFARGAQS